MAHFFCLKSDKIMSLKYENNPSEIKAIINVKRVKWFTSTWKQWHRKGYTSFSFAILVSRRLKNYQVQAKHSKTENFRWPSWSPITLLWLNNHQSNTWRLEILLLFKLFSLLSPVVNLLLRCFELLRVIHSWLDHRKYDLKVRLKEGIHRNWR